MSDFTPQKFTGLRIPEVPIRPQDYVFGAPNNPLGSLGLRVINPTGKWKDYRPPLQQQNNPKNGFDSNDCTGYGLCRKAATFFNYMLWNNLLPAAFVSFCKEKGYITYPPEYDKGTFMFDPHVLGIMAGTTSQGNWLQVVADTVRKCGLLPALTLPDVTAYSDYPSYYDQKLITPEIRALGLEFLKYVDFPYQWITSGTAADYLKASPLYVALCTCGGWNQPPVNWCNAGDASNHCVSEVEDDEAEIILDSYPPDLKQLIGGYNIPYRMAILITVKDQSTMQKTIGYKKQNDATVYVSVGSCLVPVADWNAFVALGGDSNSVVTLADSELAKFTIVSSTMFKSN